MKHAYRVTHDIVAKLWNLCNILRDDGVTYTDYVTELTFLLFLKMLAETGHEERLPRAHRWRNLTERNGDELLTYYRRLLLDLGSPKKTQDRTVLAVFSDARTKLRKPANLATLAKELDKLDWFSARDEGLGTVYEGLLEKNAAETKSGAGQYFTPRPLIDCMVRLVKPKPGEIVQDPAAGTGGFLVAADRYIKDHTNDLHTLGRSQASFQRQLSLVGIELVPETHRLCLMNLILHGVEPRVSSGDALAPDGERIDKADVVLTNPPFGSKKGGGRPTRSDFSITAETSNKQLAFLEHIVRTLKPGGRAAVIVPDNVLFEDGIGRRLRTWMMELCQVHTLLRLPTGIFYAQGVKTNVVFFTRGTNDKGNTKGIWVYDLRANMSSFGKTRPLTGADFSPFEKAFGDDPRGRSARRDEGDLGRFRYFGRKQIAARGDNLDISWLKDKSREPGDDMTRTDELSAAIFAHLTNAFEELTALSEELKAPAARAAKS